MSRKPTTTSTEPAAAETPERVDPLATVSFGTPLMEAFARAIAPFVDHQTECVGDPCTCGLSAALADLQRREQVIRRYGVE